MINKIIAQYLSANKRLVIPEFGAFIRKDTGETVFVEFLKKDDQVFTKLICDAYGVSDSDARLITEQFITEVRKSIDRTGMYVIEGLGGLHKDGNGIYELRYDPAITMPDTTAPAPKIETVPEKTIVIERTEPVPTPPTPIIPKEVPVETPVRPQAAAPVQTIADKIAATAAKEPVRDYSRIYDSEPVATPKPANPTPMHNSRPPRPAPRPVQQKKKTDLVMIIAIIAAVIAIGTIIFGILVNNNPVMNIKPTSPAQVETVDTPADDQLTDESDE